MNHARTRRRGMRCGGRQNQYFYSRTHAGLRAPHPRGAACSVQRPASVAAVAAAPRARRWRAVRVNLKTAAAPWTGERRRRRIDAPCTPDGRGEDRRRYVAPSEWASRRASASARAGVPCPLTFGRARLFTMRDEPVNTVTPHGPLTVAATVNTAAEWVDGKVQNAGAREIISMQLAHHFEVSDV